MKTSLKKFLDQRLLLVISKLDVWSPTYFTDKPI